MFGSSEEKRFAFADKNKHKKKKQKKRRYFLLRPKIFSSLRICDEIERTNARKSENIRNNDGQTRMDFYPYSVRCVAGNAEYEMPNGINVTINIMRGQQLNKNNIFSLSVAPFCLPESTVHSPCANTTNLSVCAVCSYRSYVSHPVCALGVRRCCEWQTNTYKMEFGRIFGMCQIALLAN